jgi:bacteriocin biosynthesis cyclodehydratase domain-containing protein
MTRRSARLRPLVEVLEARDGSVYLLRGPAQGDLAIRELAAEDRARLRTLAAGGPAGGERAGALLDALAAADLLEPEPAPGERLAPHERERFDRQLLYLRQVATAAAPADALQRRLRRARVVVLGCGGLGTWTAWSLACLGIGSLVLVDDDRVDASNLNRQLLFAAADVGRPKADVARERLLAFDPALDVRALRRRVAGPDDVAELVAGADVVLGLADSPPYDIARWIDDGCARAGVPHLSAGQLPPLVRAGPFVVPGATPCLRCFERTLRADTPLYDELEAMRKADPRPAATLGPACGLVGSILALDVLAFLTGLHEPATWGRALSIDMRTMESTRVPVVGEPGCACALRPEGAASSVGA